MIEGICGGLGFGLGDPAAKFLGAGPRSLRAGLGGLGLVLGGPGQLVGDAAGRRFWIPGRHQTSLSLGAETCPPAHVSALRPVSESFLTTGPHRIRYATVKQCD